GADAGSAKGIPVSLHGREAVWDADRADREGDACDLQRTRVLGAAIDSETVLWRTAANPCCAWRLRHTARVTNRHTHWLYRPPVLRQKLLRKLTESLWRQKSAVMCQDEK